MTIDTILRRAEVLKARGKSNSAHYADIAVGLFTKPVRIGRQAVGWPASEVAIINQARIAGKSDDEIRELVKQLHEKRQAAVPA